MNWSFFVVEIKILFDLKKKKKQVNEKALKFKVKAK